MKLLTETEIPVLHRDGRVAYIWRFSAGRVLERTRWYPMFARLRLDAATRAAPEPEVTNFEADLCFVADGHLAYLCHGLDIAPERGFPDQQLRGGGVLGGQPRLPLLRRGPRSQRLVPRRVRPWVHADFGARGP